MKLCGHGVDLALLGDRNGLNGRTATTQVSQRRSDVRTEPRVVYKGQQHLRTGNGCAKLGFTCSADDRAVAGRQDLRQRLPNQRVRISDENFYHVAR